MPKHYCIIQKSKNLNLKQNEYNQKEMYFINKHLLFTNIYTKGVSLDKNAVEPVLSFKWYEGYLVK